MKCWWQRELAEARARADRAERELPNSSAQRAEAERVDEYAKHLEEDLRRELAKNGFADALRAAFGSTR